MHLPENMPLTSIATYILNEIREVYPCVRKHIRKSMEYLSQSMLEHSRVAFNGSSSVDMLLC